MTLSLSKGPSKPFDLPDWPKYDKPLMPHRMSLSEQSESKTPPWFVYIAKAHTGRFYVGISIDPQSRLKDHNSKKGSRFAKQQGPFQLVYVSPPFPAKLMARMRETQIKGWSRDKKLKLISGEWK